MKLQIFRPHERHDWIRMLRQAGMRVQVVHKESLVKNTFPILMDTVYTQWQAFAENWREEGRNIWLLVDPDPVTEELAASYPGRLIFSDWPVEKVRQQFQGNTQPEGTLSEEPAVASIDQEPTDVVPLSQRRRIQTTPAFEDREKGEVEPETSLPIHVGQESQAPLNPPCFTDEARPDFPNELSSMMAVYGAKGGIGKTTFILNLAAILTKRGISVLVLDLDLFLGTLASAVHIHPSKTITDAVRVLNDPNELFACLVKLEAGFSLLASPNSYMDISGITEKTLEQLIALLKPYFNVVLVDTSPFFDDLTTFILGHADHVLVMSTDEPTSIKNMRKMVPHVLPVIKEPSAVDLIINRAGVGIPPEKVTAFLPWAPYMVFPEDPLVHREGSNGQCVAITHPESPYVQRLELFVNRWCGEEPLVRSPWTHRLREAWGKTRRRKGGGKQ